jgi:hypothetical protein
LCIRHALAGFSNSVTGVWTFLEVQEGDFISFLYGARAHNLYQVVKREAINEFESIPPWPPVTFRESGRTYYFPFRHSLKVVREFDEPLVRSEFAYVAENLLLGAGYRKTHFQADQTTLQNVSQMGELASRTPAPLAYPPHTPFTPVFTTRRAEKKVPFVFQFQEVILQAALRQHLHENSNLVQLLDLAKLDTRLASELEVLGERAVSVGHVDILIKDRVPIARARKLIMEEKRAKAHSVDLQQLRQYMDEFGKECIGGVLVAESFPKAVIRAAPDMRIRLLRYTLGLDWNAPRTFADIQSTLSLQPEA